MMRVHDGNIPSIRCTPQAATNAEVFLKIYILPYSTMAGEIRDVTSVGKHLGVVCLLATDWNEVSQTLEMVCHRCDLEGEKDRP